MGVEEDQRAVAKILGNNKKRDQYIALNVEEWTLLCTADDIECLFEFMHNATRAIYRRSKLAVRRIYDDEFFLKDR